MTTADVLSPAEAVDGMLPVVRNMHTTSGLIDELGAGVTLAEAQEHDPDTKVRAYAAKALAKLREDH